MLIVYRYKLYATYGERIQQIEVIIDVICDAACLVAVAVSLLTSVQYSAAKRRF